MAVFKQNIGKLRFTFVFRYKGDKEDKRRFGTTFKTYQLGLFCRKDKIVSKFQKNKKPKLVPHYMFGLHLIWIHMWLTVDYDALGVKI